jgi:hypothetical protein
MIRKLDCSVHVYYNNRTEKLLKLEPKKIQKSVENLRAELTHVNGAKSCILAFS